jgi:hypothetical protein
MTDKRSGKRAPFEPGREWRTVNAIHRKELPMPEKSLLIAIAKHEARRHRVCYASVRTLSSDAGCDEKTGRRVLKRLEKKYKLIRVRKVRGATSHIVINLERFKRFTETTPPKIGRGTSRREPLPKLGVPPLPNLGVPTPPKIGSQGVKNPEGGESGSVCVVVEKTSGEIVNHHHPSQAQKLCSPNGDRLDDFKKIVLAKCKDPDGILPTALDIIIERARRSGINVTSPKYLEVALDRFNFHEGQDREDWMAASRGRASKET